MLTYSFLVRQGQSLEGIIDDLGRAKLACDKAKEELRDMYVLLRVGCRTFYHDYRLIYLHSFSVDL